MVQLGICCPYSLHGHCYLCLLTYARRLSIFCSHLLQLAKKDGNPLDFEFVEHHKVRISEKLLFSSLSFSTKLFYHDIFCILLSRLRHLHSLLSARRAYGTLMASSFKLINFQLKYFVDLLTYLLLVPKPKVVESLQIFVITCSKAI